MADNSEIFRQVRDAVDIVDIIAEHIALKRAGKEFKCVCPFHDDHRPSMAVVPQKQIFHCFVCGTGGDVFKFVTQYHKMTNGEALRFLAQKAGIVLPELPPRGNRGPGQSGSDDRSAREIILDANEKACGFFERHLRTPEGKPGLDYLLARGLADETLSKFRLGYSPEGWTALVTAAGRIGLRGDHMEQAGLVKKRGDGSLYDAFRGRVMFPIMDAAGKIVAFGGRILVEKRDEAGNVIEAKYLNSPETRVFNKSESLYGLNLAKRAIIESQTVVVVEGYMDVIACHQAGVTNVVATLGTALTPEHAKILRRFCQTVILVFDSDDAGFRAADRAMETFVREPLDVKIASVPDGKDPCDFCISRGPAAGEAFRAVLAGAVDALTYQWTRTQRQFTSTDSLSGRQAAAAQFMKYVAAALSAGGNRIDPIRRGLLLNKISGLVGMSVEQVTATLKKMGQIGGTSPGPAPATIPAGKIDDPIPVASGPMQGLALAEARVLGALLTDPALYERVREEMDLRIFEALADLAQRIMEYLEHAPQLAACSLAEFTGQFEDNERTLLTQAVRVQQLVEAGGKAEQDLLDGWKWLCQERLKAVDTVELDGLPSIHESQSQPAPEFNDLARMLAESRAKHSRGEVGRFVPRNG